MESVTLTHLVELLLLFSGGKNAVRLVVQNAEYEGLRLLAKEAGLTVCPCTKKFAPVHSSTLGDRFFTTVDWDDPSGDTFAVYLSILPTFAQRGAKAESTQQNDATLGTLLQIPSCCMEAYARLKKGESWLRLWVEDTANFDFGFRLSNHISSYISGCSLHGDYLPCALHCRPTLQKARKSSETLMDFGLDSLLDHALIWGASPVLILADQLIFLRGQEPLEQGRRFRVRQDSLRTHGPSVCVSSETLDNIREIEILPELVRVIGEISYNIDLRTVFHKFLNFR